MASRLSWRIASRYLQRQKRWTLRVHFVTLAILASNVVAYAALLLLQHKFQLPPPRLTNFLRIYSLASLVGVVEIGMLIELLRRLHIFPAISTFGLFLGASALVVVLSVMSGFEQDLKQKILGANAHVTVTTPDRPFTDYAVAEQKIRTATDGKVTPFISNEVMVSSQANLAGVLLKGIDPRSAGEVTDLAKNLEQGSLDNLMHPEKLRELGGPPPDIDDDANDEDAPKPKPGKSGVKFEPAGKKAIVEPPPVPRRILPGLFIGRELAKNLHLYVGDDVNVISPMGDIGPAGPMPRSRPFRVAGIFYSGMYEYDTKFVYMTIEAAQKFLALDGEITGFELRVKDPDHTEPVVERVRAALGPGYDVSDWKELNRNLFSALRVEKVAMFVFLCFIILVAGFSIVANGIMLVREKRRDIAILKSMGAGDRAVLGTFMIMGLYMGAVGIDAGILVGVVTCLLLGRFGIALDTDVYYINQLPVNLNGFEVAAVFAAAMAIVLIATIYPALVAARLRPVDGLRYEQA